MTHILSYPKMGNIKVYDVSRNVDMTKPKAGFYMLGKDRYVPEGFRKCFHSL